jgi:hypothetical protein
MYPDSCLNEQYVCSQVNSVIRRKVFSLAGLENFKMEIRISLDSQTRQVETVKEETGSELDKSALIDGGNRRLEAKQPLNYIAQILKDKFEVAKICYQGIPLGYRPMIPRLHCNAKIYQTVGAMDQVLALEVADMENLVDLVGLVHCAAIATCQVLGYKIKTRAETNTSEKSKKESKSIHAWKQRIEDKINRARRNISQLAEFFKNKEHSSKKVLAGVRIILKR